MHLISSSALLSVIMAEKNNDGANFTIRSKNTDVEYTYQISRSFFNGRWYTHIKVEQGYLNFVRLGTYYRGAITNKGRAVSSPSAIAIAFVLNKVENKQFDFLDSKMEVMHLGKCLRCGRTLTDSNSISIGLGPICQSF